MQPEGVVYHFHWLPPGWRFLKAEWLGEALISLQPCSANTYEKAIAKRDKVLEEVLAGRLPGTAIEVVDHSRSEWAAKALAALRTVPFGTTATYKDLATMAGNPLAARAAARVCAGNRVCLVVPCHRILPVSGGVGGFHWGPALKEIMIHWERNQAKPGRIKPI